MNVIVIRKRDTGKVLDVVEVPHCLTEDATALAWARYGGFRDVPKDVIVDSGNIHLLKADKLLFSMLACCVVEELEDDVTRTKEIELKGKIEALRDARKAR